MDTTEHLWDIVKHFDQAMLVTRPGEELHARPMAVAATEEGATYFATSIDSPKVAEIEADPRVLVTFQGRSEFAALYGAATIVRDRALIDQLWSSAWQVWFPAGKDDPTLCLLRIEPTAGEYWDNSGSEGRSYLFEGLRAILQRRRPEVDRDQNAKVDL